jgi:hypothetical protein
MREERQRRLVVLARLVQLPRALRRAGGEEVAVERDRALRCCGERGRQLGERLIVPAAKVEEPRQTDARRRRPRRSSAPA